MAVLITGGAGFIGLNAAEQLLARGEEVVLFGPAPPPAVALTQLRQMPGRLHLALGDVSVAADIDAAEAALRAAVPSARYIFLEPDIDRGAAL